MCGDTVDRDHRRNTTLWSGMARDTYAAVWDGTRYTRAVWDGIRDRGAAGGSGLYSVRCALEAWNERARFPSRMR